MKIPKRKPAFRLKTSEVEHVPFKMHPRVFQALGAELVTSDVIAVIELVKNSYDAFASRVDVRFGVQEDGTTYLDIDDDGLGMTKAIIDDVWCTVATPFRIKHPRSEKDGKVRRTTGAKGLGRLSAARLGKNMILTTRAPGNRGWTISVDWSELPGADSIDACYALRSPIGPGVLTDGGTKIRILDLNSSWDLEQVRDLEEALARLTSPFGRVERFDVFVTPPGAEAVPTKIRTSEFLKHPPYSIKGNFTASGTIEYKYVYKPWRGKERRVEQERSWAIVQADINRTLDKSVAQKSFVLKDEPECGPFEFEIRVWDLDQDSMQESEERFKTRRSALRSQIKAFKGLSLYRDSVLVLPKSDNNRDWLGLDLRRVSKIGERLSTSQMVGYVAITADDNPGIEDTSDRERLVRSSEALEFERVLRNIVSLLETERDHDHEKPEPKLRDLFNEISPRKLIEEVQDVIAENGTASDVLPLIASYSKRVERATLQIERQLVYYNRLATVGTISEMLVHEVGSNSAILGAFTKAVRSWFGGEQSAKAKSILDARTKLAEKSVVTLTQLAERFRPLANRSFVTGRHTASLREAVEACLLNFTEQTTQYRIAVETDLQGPDMLKLSSGELYSLIHNLVDNSIYWLLQADESRRKIEIESSRSGKSGYCVLSVSDTGPGIPEEDQKAIFLPGVTRRPNGFGMGLTVVGDIAESAGGSVCLTHPGVLNGATFVIELPVAD